MANQDANNSKETGNAAKYKRGEHPNSKKNLGKGMFQEGNTVGGRTEGAKNLSTLLKEMLADIAPGEIINSKFVKEFCKGKRSITNADALTARLVSEGIIKGEAWAVKEIFERTEGKAAQSLHLSGADGGAIKNETTVNFADPLIVEKYQIFADEFKK